MDCGPGGERPGPAAATLAPVRAAPTRDRTPASAPAWSPTSPSSLASAATAAALLALGVAGLARPVQGAAFYGVPLHDPRDAPLVRAAAARDLATGTALAALTALRLPTAAGVLLLGAAVITAADAALVTAARRTEVDPARRPRLWQLAQHGGGAVVTSLVGLALVRSADAGR